MTDAPCGEHGAGTGFVLYVALSRGGELCPAQSHPCTVLYCTVSGTESPLQSQLGPGRGALLWTWAREISYEDITVHGCYIRRLLCCHLLQDPHLQFLLVSNCDSSWGVVCLGGGWLELPCYRPSVARSCCLPTRPPLARDPATWRRVQHCNVDTTQAGHEGHEGGRVSRGCNEDVTKM